MADDWAFKLTHNLLKRAYEPDIVLAEAYEPNIADYVDGHLKKLNDLEQKIPFCRQQFNDYFGDDDEQGRNLLFSQMKVAIKQAKKWLKSGPDYYESARAELNRIDTLCWIINYYNLLQSIEEKTEPLIQKNTISSRASKAGKERQKQATEARISASEIASQLLKGKNTKEIPIAQIVRQIFDNWSLNHPNWKYNADTVTGYIRDLWGSEPLKPGRRSK